MTSSRAEDYDDDPDQRNRSHRRHPDKDYNLIRFTEHCLSNALRLDVFIADAERGGDNELAGLFRKAQADSKKGAELGKQLLRSRLES